MVGLSVAYVHSHTLPPVVAAFNGLQTIVVAIVANATLSFGKTSLKSLRDGMIAMVAASLFGLRVNPVWVIILAGLLGLVISKKNSPPMSTINLERISRSTRPLLILASVAALAFGVLFFVERKLFDLAAIMFRIDLFAFGGGFASLPLMFHEIVEVRSWMDGQTFLNGIALGQITPGPIVITATFVGYILSGMVGAVVATLSVFLPSFLIVNGIIPYFDRLRRSIYFSRTIDAILCSFVGLLLAVTFRFGSNISWDIPRVLLATAAFVALISKVEIVWIVLLGTVVSMFFL
jgi:chromate transporter